MLAFGAVQHLLAAAVMALTSQWYLSGCVVLALVYTCGFANLAVVRHASVSNLGVTRL